MSENGNTPRRRASGRRGRVSARRRAIYRRRRLAAASVLLAVIVFGVVAIAEALRGHHHRHDGDKAGHRSGVAGKVAAAAGKRAREDAGVERALSYTSFFQRGVPRKREVAITFDDGPGPYTPEILRVLRRTRTPATFFVVGSMLTWFSDSLRAERRSGFAIGSHTEDHVAMGRLDEAGQIAQLDQQAKAISEAGGSRERLFRPPYGSYDQATLKLLRRRGMLMVLWSVDTEDYERPGVGKIVETALAGARPGAVILLHDAGGDRSQTVAALPQILRGLRRRHLRPVTVPQLVRDDPPPQGQRLPDRLGGS